MSRRSAILQDYGGSFPEQSHDAEKAAAGYYQRDKELAAQMQQHKDNQKAKQQGDATDYITGLKVEPVGDNTIDLYNNQQLKGVQDELIGMMQKGAGVNDIKIAAIPKLQKIAQGYTIAKNEYGKIASGVKDFGKDYPTGDMEAARNIAGNEMLKTIFEFDDKGQVKGYKDPSLIPTDKNYFQNLTTNENLPKWYRRGASFEKGIKDLPLIPIKGGTTRTDKYGGKVKQTFTGHGSVFDEPVVNEEGEQTGWRLKSENVPLGKNPDGSVIIEQVMPKEQFELALSSPSARLDFESDFNRYLEETGVNPDRLDPRAKDVLQRKFAYDLFDKTGIHGSSFLTTDEIKAAPVKNITNVSVNNGKPEPPAIDIYTPLRTQMDDPDRKEARTIEGKYIKMIPSNSLTEQQLSVLIPMAKAQYGDDVNVENLYIRDVEGTLRAFITDSKDGKISEKDTMLGEITKRGANMSANKPLGQKSVAKAVEQSGKGKPSTSKTFNIIDPTTGKVVMSNVDQSAADKAKAKGYKIQ